MTAAKICEKSNFCHSVVSYRMSVFLTSAPSKESMKASLAFSSASFLTGLFCRSYCTHPGRASMLTRGVSLGLINPAKATKYSRLLVHSATCLNIRWAICFSDTLAGEESRGVQAELRGGYMTSSRVSNTRTNVCWHKVRVHTQKRHISCVNSNAIEVCERQSVAQPEP